MTTQFEMRYGCNPHQGSARCYVDSGQEIPLTVLNGGPSYINLLDALNSWQLVRELKQAVGLPAAASFKHVSPAGAAVATPMSDDTRKAYFVDDLELSPLAEAYVRARGGDRLASYGDWVALSERVDQATANVISREVSDGIIAPGYDDDALATIAAKKGGSYPVLQMDESYEPPAIESRSVFGLTLEQDRNVFLPGADFLDNAVTSARTLPAAARRDLLVATITVKYTQSNSVCLARDGQVIGNGAGQQSRVHCVRLAAAKADNWYLRQHPRVAELRFKRSTRRAARINAIDLFLQEEATPAELQAWRAHFEEAPAPLTREEKREWLDGLNGVAMSSDAFFPFRDNIDRAQRSGVQYIVQAGGSVQDEEVIAAADEYGMVMINSGVRLFHH